MRSPREEEAGGMTRSSLVETECMISRIEVTTRPTLRYPMAMGLESLQGRDGERDKGKPIGRKRAQNQMITTKSHNKHSPITNKATNETLFA